MGKDIHQIHIYTTDSDLIQRLKDEAHHQRTSKSQLALQYILHGLNEAEREAESPIYERPGIGAGTAGQYGLTPEPPEDE